MSAAPLSSRAVALVRSEWVALTSLRSLRASLLGASALSLVIAAGLCLARRGQRPGALFDPTVLSLLGLLISQLVVALVGVLSFAGEQEAGSLRASVAAAGRRLPLYVAKVAVFAFLAVLAGELSAFGDFLLGQRALGPRQGASLADPVVLGAVGLGGLSVALVGLVGLGVATVLRRRAPAIAAVAALLFLLPALMARLPLVIENALDRYLVVNLFAVLVDVRGGALVGFGLAGTGVPRATLFSRPVALGVLAAYALVSLAAGAWCFARRDV